MYIVLGETSSLKSSRRIIYRYKSEEELKDIFVAEKLGKSARRLLVFRVVNGDAWYLVSFDIKKIMGVSGARKATKEYSLVKEKMFLGLCGRIDYSTYICPSDTSSIPRRYTESVVVYAVEPYDDKTLEAVRESIEETIEWLSEKLAEKVSKLRARGVVKARAMLSAVDEVMRTAGRKIEALGVSLEPLARARTELERALGG